MRALTQPSTIPTLLQMRRRVKDCAERLAAFVEHLVAGIA
jgi:hypothetical protein